MTDYIPELAIFPFSYSIVRSRRKTLTIYVKGGRVEARAPLNTPEEWVDFFVREKAPWICDQLKDQQQKMRQRLVIADNSEVCFLGRPRIVQVALGRQDKVELKDDFLFIHTRENDPRRLEKIFHRWLLRQAREYMAPRSITIARQLGVGERLKDVVFRKTRSKWGHCCRDGTIQYNWLTMMAPRKVVDYLVAHECSHLLHMNHSAAFWRTVASVCPDWQMHRDWLKDNGHRLWTD